ncbi:polysaccharide deacetylase family protein [Paremcibacter congregatus]|uniref:polysaccharide deacetylase family protein n=1 Tax=Paremcibacter congregatus TaxID=2043170 RepID=UPI0030EB5B8A|tara:strand:- start:19931 stop:21010 length:1080 start_codon:yes stop_codon:yes gene_type:complete
MTKRFLQTSLRKSLLLAGFCILLTLFGVALSQNTRAQQGETATQEDSAIILMYHRFGETQFPTTNITLEQFDAHIAELSQEKYNIVPLQTIVTAFKNKTKLPPRTIAITIDDAYQSILENAWPRLKKAGIPFTLFVSSEPVNQEIPGYMTWDQIRTLADDPLVTIGHHAHSHDHLIYMTPAAAAQDIAAADESYRKELGRIPDIFAYPFGEFSPALQNILRKRNISVAFGQYSSAASSNNDLFSLPRFALNEKYAGMDRFRLIVNARALPAYDILPISAEITTNPPAIGFTVDKNIRGLTAMSCYPSHLGKAADLSLVGNNRVEIRFDKPFPQGRNRINCTLPGPDRRWYWFGLPYFVK